MPDIKILVLRQRITNIFIRFATAMFATSGKSFIRLKIASEILQGRELAYFATCLITKI